MISRASPLQTTIHSSIASWNKTKTEATAYTREISNEEKSVSSCFGGILAY